MSGDLTLSVRLTADGKGLVEVVGQGSDAFDKFGKEATQAGKSSTKVGGDFKTLGNESKSLSSHLFSLKNLMGAVASVMLSNQALRMADDYKLLQGRIKLATESTGDYVAVSEKLYSITQSNGAALEGSVGLFQSLARAAPELQATNNEVLTLTKLIQQTGVVSGASTQAMSAGMLQFGQAMAGGVLRAEEMNSLLENMPELANQIAAGMGLTSGKLRLAVNDGRILSEDVFRVLLGQADGVQQKFDAMPLGLERAGTMLENSFSRVFASADQVVGATGTLAGGLQSVSEWLDAISASDIDETLKTTAVIVTALSAAIATRYVVSLAAATMAQIQATRGATGMSAALGVQTTMTTSQATANIALATTARVATTAMAFLGGPAGIIIASVAALGVYVATSRDAAHETDALAASTDKLAGSMAGVAKMGVSRQIDDTTASITRANSKIAGYQEIISKLQTQAGSYARVAYFRNEIEKEQLTVDELQQKLVGLEETRSRIAGLNVPKAKKAKAEKEDTSLKDLLVDLDSQRNALTMNKAELVVYTAAMAVSKAENKSFALAVLQSAQALADAQAANDADLAVAKRKTQAEQEYEAVRQGLFDQEGALAASYQRRVEITVLAHDAGAITEVERNQQLLNLEQQYQDQKLLIQQQGMTAEQRLWASGWQGKTQIVAQAGGAIAQLLMAGSKKQFEIGKMFARASIVADTAQAVMKAWAQGGPWLGPALAITAAAQGALQLRNLNSTQFGGGGAVNAGVASPATSQQGSTGLQNLGLPANQNMQPAQKVDIHVYGNMVDLAGLARDMKSYNIELARDVI